MCLFAPFLGIPALLGGAGGAAAAGGAVAGASGLSTALQAIGTAVGAFGSIAGGIQANNVAKYNSEVAKNNATAEKDRAAYDAGLIKDKQRRIAASQNAGFTASGIDPQSGTPVAVLGDSAKSSELDVLSRLYSGESSATAFNNDANRFRAEGKAQQTAGFLGAGTTLLTGLGKIASQPKTFGYRVPA